MLVPHSNNPSLTVTSSIDEELTERLLLTTAATDEGDAKAQTGTFNQQDEGESNSLKMFVSPQTDNIFGALASGGSVSSLCGSDFGQTVETKNLTTEGEIDELFSLTNDIVNAESTKSGSSTRRKLQKDDSASDSQSGLTCKTNANTTSNKAVGSPARVHLVNGGTPTDGNAVDCGCGVFTLSGDANINSPDVLTTQKTPGLCVSPLRKGQVLLMNSNTSTFNIEHNWTALNHKLDFWYRDIFHVLLTVPFKFLFLSIFIFYFVYGTMLAIGLGIATRGNVLGCLGGSVSSYFDYYFFTIETMFTIGFGAPRYPSCPASNVFVSIAVMSRNIIDGIVIGLLFAKFSTGTTRRWALVFSSELCGAVDTSNEYLLRCATKHHQTSEDNPNQYASSFENQASTNLDPVTEFTSSISQGNLRPKTSLTKSKTGIRHTYFSSNGVRKTTLRPMGSCIAPSKQPLSNDEEGGPTAPFSDSHYFRLDTDYGLLRNAPHHITDHTSVADVARSSIFRGAVVPSRNSLHHPTMSPRKDGLDMFFINNSTFNLDVPEWVVRSSSPPRPSNQPLLDTVRSGEEDTNQGMISMTSDRGEMPMSEVYTNLDFTLSFRLMNLTTSSFFDPRLAIYLLCHYEHDLIISQFESYHTDVPLEFLEMPITVTLDSRDANSPLQDVDFKDIISSPDRFEILVLLTFIDNQSSRTIELRKSWRLDSTIWGYSFQNIVRRDPNSTLGQYNIDVESLDAKMPMDDPFNSYFVSRLRKLYGAQHINVNLMSPH